MKKKLHINKTTLRLLNPDNVAKVRGGGWGGDWGDVSLGSCELTCAYSCSCIVYTWVSCLRYC